MRIGVVCHPTFGGSGVMATELANHLGRMGHELHVISYAQPVRLDPFNTQVHFHEVQVQDYPLFLYQPYELALSSAMVETVRKEKLDILHVHYAIPHAYAAFMARQILADQGIHIPVVTTLHGTDITLVGQLPAYKPAVCFSINRSTAVTAVSESLRAETIREFNIERDIQVVPNFVDVKRYGRGDASARSRLAQPDEAIVCHVSNFRKVKRIPDVLHVFAEIRAQRAAKLVMVGDGPERLPAERLAAELGISQDVLFLGKTSNVERILGVSDLFLLPSETESFGLAALEAMASSVPVIASRAGGLPEVVDHGVTGYLEDIGDVSAMAQRALHILSSESTLAMFSQQALEAAHRFSMEQIGQAYLDLYTSLLHGEQAHR
ncbi:MAG: N-acetyl-alpha-D-glucosaminyl L-malate synthase BshA [Flavobacteriia bacterium]|nr:N-acetyl-alpha-D-glucosaminyl L-malate synthase BshA [Flavobacteriia bacterium]NDA07300.1 N-acetyl-alpha-D-glucosaminyl L-malate synthase BshA [Flavobacteriia bacterium]NDA28551.1 N-acetyl-alpha-D-glucosaminyl L-malate synthase BshA [Flavobacteriia bacterium]NDD19420.1 N-acetyl-alpha-D-glucosaminyl L-malate synthase BshA [Flavobacteriia bacterium]NDD80269.1 N-acetyl-alpha-D-glucosaminyl L-malate synthase BshA [Flavobacteriia bacterium]